MIKKIFILLFFILCINGCSHSTVPGEDTPVWLKIKINEMSVNNYYFGTTVFRYTYGNKYVYDITIPLSSCAFCEVYNHDGTKFDSRFIDDFLQKRKERYLVWVFGGEG